MQYLFTEKVLRSYVVTADSLIEAQSKLDNGEVEGIDYDWEVVSIDEADAFGFPVRALYPNEEV